VVPEKKSDYLHFCKNYPLPPFTYL